jgi:hypothetical protein
MHHKHKLAIGLLAVIAYLYSPWAIVDTYKSLVGNLLRLDQSAFIASLALLIKMERENKFIYAIEIGLLSFVTFEVFPVDSYRFFILLTLAYAAVGFYALLFRNKEDRIRVFSFLLKAYSLTASVCILVNLWRILPFMKEFAMPFVKLSAQLSIGPWNKESTLLNTLRILNAWGFREYAPYANMYYENPFLIIATFTVPLFAFGGLLFKRNKRISHVALLTVLTLFLCKGENPPFGEIFISLVDFNVKSLFYPFKAFHGTGVLTMHVLTLEYAVLIAYTVYNIIRLIGKKLIKKHISLRSSIIQRSTIYFIIASILLVPLLYSSYPLLTGEVLENWWLWREHNERTFGVRIPEDYFQARKILERDACDYYPLFRALLLPKLQTYVMTSWGSQGTAAFYNRFFTTPLITGRVIGYDIYQFNIDPWTIPLNIIDKIDLVPFIEKIISWQKDFTLMAKEGVFWKINTTCYVDSPHDLALMFKESLDWQNYTHLVLTINSKTFDLKRLFIGLRDINGFVGWYTAYNCLDKYNFDYKEGRSFSLYVPLCTRPELGTFNSTAVNGVIIRYLPKIGEEGSDIQALIKELYVAIGTPDSSLWSKTISLLNVKYIIIDKSIELGNATNYADFFDLLNSEFFDKIYESKNIVIFRNNLLDLPIHIFDIKSENSQNLKTILGHYREKEEATVLDFKKMRYEGFKFTVYTNSTTSIILVFPTYYDRGFNLTVKISTECPVKHISFFGLNAWVIEDLPKNQKIPVIVRFDSLVYKLLLLVSVLSIVVSAAILAKNSGCFSH